jgi:hypothetical protein
VVDVRDPFETRHRLLISRAQLPFSEKTDDSPRFDRTAFVEDGKKVPDSRMTRSNFSFPLKS